MDKHTDRNDITELIFAISNIAHSEYHLIESMCINKDIIPNDLEDILGRLRETRINLMLKLSNDRPALSGLWCTFKHLFLTLFHLYELYERNYEYIYTDEASKIMLIIDDLLSINVQNFKSCPRCDKDKENI